MLEHDRIAHNKVMVVVQRCPWLYTGEDLATMGLKLRHRVLYDLDESAPSGFSPNIILRIRVRPLFSERFIRKRGVVHA
jgi:hypothetical protein